MTTYVALLRGINVGGNNLVSMRDLVQSFTELGYSNVRSYINSGNVIFQSPLADPRALEDELESALARHFSARIRVLVRDVAAMRALVASIDRTCVAAADERHNVIFLAAEIDTERVLDGLHPDASIESVEYVPGVLLWSAKTAALSRSQMLKVNRMEIYKSMTVRGVNTVRQIYRLMSAIEASQTRV
jgi:uncharacterized protein (DUF1697 family)